MHGGKLASLISAACLVVAGVHADPVTVYWSDGDSGYLNLPESKGRIPFRLHGIDTPETGGVGSIGGAKCEAERQLGYAAKETAANFTTSFGNLDIAASYGIDPHQRLVIDLTSNEWDVAALLVSVGAAKRWNYDGGKPKPDWCSEN